MKHPFTVTRKVAAGYLVLVFFSLVAMVYALNRLHDQTTRTESLISVDFRSLGLARNLRQGLLAQEALEKQYLILRDPTFLSLLDRRQDELEIYWKTLGALPLGDFLTRSTPLFTAFWQQTENCRELLETGARPKAEACLTARSPLRQKLLLELDTFMDNRQALLDSSLVELNRTGARSYRFTLLLAFLGIAFSAPVAMAIILDIHRAVTALTRAAREIAGGRFSHPIPLANRGDEFGTLAREFSDMGRKLSELEQLRLDANPLTHLPGNLAIERELEKRLQAHTPFAHLYLDLDHFKAYNDRYGYRAGSEIISRMAVLIRHGVARTGTSADMIGHIGGDDFVIITETDRAEPMAREIIEEFDRIVPEFYSSEDRSAGYFIAEDRFGEQRRFSFLTLSIAIVCSDLLDSPSPQAISRACVNMKEHLKTLPGSNLLIERRRIGS